MGSSNSGSLCTAFVGLVICVAGLCSLCHYLRKGKESYGTMCYGNGIKLAAGFKMMCSSHRGLVLCKDLL
jgi:hypothetical protein